MPDLPSAIDSNSLMARSSLVRCPCSSAAENVVAPPPRSRVIHRASCVSLAVGSRNALCALMSFCLTSVAKLLNISTVSAARTIIDVSEPISSKKKLPIALRTWLITFSGTFSFFHIVVSDSSALYAGCCSLLAGLIESSISSLISLRMMRPDSGP